MKEAGMRIRVEPELRQEFVELCRRNDITAAQVLRQFMRDFIQIKKTNTTVHDLKKITKKLQNNKSEK